MKHLNVERRSAATDEELGELTRTNNPEEINIESEDESEGEAVQGQWGYVRVKGEAMLGQSGYLGVGVRDRSKASTVVVQGVTMSIPRDGHQGSKVIMQCKVNGDFLTFLTKLAFCWSCWCTTSVISVHRVRRPV